MENQLLKKLQIKAGFDVSVINAPENAAVIFGDVPQSVNFNYTIQPQLNAYLVFAITKADMITALKEIQPWIKEPIIVWILYPKAKTSLASDLNLMQSWDELKSFELAPCASAAINELWTAIRIKPVSAQKKSGVGNAEIKDNEYGKYIDVSNKRITLPEELKAYLSQHPEALSYYEQLAYSHKKEYVLWVITAKQEKTKIDRMEKMISMLLQKKKNPSAK
jgi:hypothetical protein